jgi:hypothetical protein
MGFFADPWLHEARERIKHLPSQPKEAFTLNPGDVDTLVEAVEKAIKAALIECHGSLPQKHDHKNLVTLCQSTGVWDVLPPALKNLVQEVESYHSGLSSAPQQLQAYFTITRGLIDYMEYHVIGNNSVLKRLKVA